jgi:Glyoxalase/Bleomycin resistance protein/Dioxygenase superfamily
MEITHTMARPAHRLFEGPEPTGEFSFFQIASIVPDLIPACRQWTRVYGAGPFRVLPKRTGVVNHRGRRTELELHVALAQMGPVQIELIQQTSETDSIYRDIYPAGTGGVHHLCTIVKDFDAVRSHYEAVGYECVAFIDGPMRIGYFDTHRDFGFVTEVIEHNDQFLADLIDIAQICATWDGRDPIRLLHRGGYTTPDENGAGVG